MSFPSFRDLVDELVAGRPVVLSRTEEFDTGCRQTRDIDVTAAINVATHFGLQINIFDARGRNEAHVIEVYTTETQQLANVAIVNIALLNHSSF